MRIEQLQAFLDVCNTQSLNKSAENLYISQPALTRSIQTMENELGVVLFERTKTGIFLNKTGEALLRHAQAIVAEYEKMLLSISQTLTFPSDISIALNLALATLLPFILNELKINFPTLSVNIRELPPREIYRTLVNHPKNSVAIVISCESYAVGPIGVEADRFVAYDIVSDEICYFASTASPYAHMNVLSSKYLHEANANTLLLYNYENTGSIKHSVSTQVASMKSLVLYQEHLALLPKRIGEMLFADEPNICAISSTESVEIKYQLLVHKGFDESFRPIITPLLQVLRNCFTN